MNAEPKRTSHDLPSEVSHSPTFSSPIRATDDETQLSIINDEPQSPATSQLQSCEDFSSRPYQPPPSSTHHVGGEPAQEKNQTSEDEDGKSIERRTDQKNEGKGSTRRPYRKMVFKLPESVEDCDISPVCNAQGDLRPGAISIPGPALANLARDRHSDSEGSVSNEDCVTELVANDSGLAEHILNATLVHNEEISPQPDIGFAEAAPLKNDAQTPTSERSRIFLIVGVLLLIGGIVVAISVPLAIQNGRASPSLPPSPTTAPTLHFDPSIKYEIGIAHDGLYGQLGWVLATNPPYDTRDADSEYVIVQNPEVCVEQLFTGWTLQQRSDGADRYNIMMEDNPVMYGEKGWGLSAIPYPGLPDVRDADSTYAFVHLLGTSFYWEIVSLTNDTYYIWFHDPQRGKMGLCADRYKITDKRSNSSTKVFVQASYSYSWFIRPVVSQTPSPSASCQGSSPFSIIRKYEFALAEDDGYGQTGWLLATNPPRDIRDSNSEYVIVRNPDSVNGNQIYTRWTLEQKIDGANRYNIITADDPAFYGGFGWALSGKPYPGLSDIRDANSTYVFVHRLEASFAWEIEALGNNTFFVWFVNETDGSRMGLSADRYYSADILDGSSTKAMVDMGRSNKWFIRQV